MPGRVCALSRRRRSVGVPRGAVLTPVACGVPVPAGGAFVRHAHRHAARAYAGGVTPRPDVTSLPRQNTKSRGLGHGVRRAACRPGTRDPPTPSAAVRAQNQSESDRAKRAELWGMVLLSGALTPQPCDNLSPPAVSSPLAPTLRRSACALSASSHVAPLLGRCCPAVCRRAIAGSPVQTPLIRSTARGVGRLICATHGCREPCDGATQLVHAARYWNQLPRFANVCGRAAARLRGTSAAAAVVDTPYCVAGAAALLAARHTRHPSIAEPHSRTAAPAFAGRPLGVHAARVRAGHDAELDVRRLQGHRAPVLAPARPASPRTCLVSLVQQPRDTRRHAPQAFEEGADSELLDSQTAKSNKNPMHMCKACVRPRPISPPLRRARASGRAGGSESGRQRERRRLWRRPPSACCLPACSYYRQFEGVPEEDIRALRTRAWLVHGTADQVRRGVCLAAVGQ